MIFELGVIQRSGGGEPEDSHWCNGVIAVRLLNHGCVIDDLAQLELWDWKP